MFRTFRFAAKCVLGWGLALAILAPFGSAHAKSTERVLYAFTGGAGDGALPAAGLIADSDGNLYGTTSAGGGAGCGGYGCGTVFELSPIQGGGWNEIVLYKFLGGTDGADPDVTLIADGVGNLYGTTSLGGSDNCGAGSGCGTVFELLPQKRGWKEKVLYSFTTKSKDNRDAAGQRPQVTKPDVWAPNGIVFGSDGNLYGFAFLGGRCDQNGHLNACYGGGFELKKPSRRRGAWHEKVIYRVRNLVNGGPEGPPIFDASGNLYGVTVGANYGSVFLLQPPSGTGKWTASTLYTFQGENDGGYPSAGLVFDASGNLYGATSGYRTLPGNVFELMPDQNGQWNETPIYTFTNSANGSTPTAVPVLDAAGDFYGMTQAGGQNNLGVVYELSPQNGSWYETVLYNFAGGSDGSAPQGTLLDSNGVLYGTTSTGGNEGCFSNAGCGTVFEVVP